MDAKDLEALAGLIRDIVREEVERAIGTRRIADHRLSQQALDQRRAAAKARWARDAKPKKKKTKNSMRPAYADPDKKSGSKSKDSCETAYAESCGISHELSTGLSTGLSTELSTGEKPPETLTQALWRVYSTSYKLRYGEFPPRNAKLNTHLKQLAARLPAEDAPGVVEHFLKLEEPALVKGLHPVALLLRDAEKYHTLWRTKAKVVNGNGHGALPQARPWWETWSGIEEMGRRLGVEQSPNEPTQFRAEVYQMAAMCGEIPREVAVKLGLRGD